MWGLPQAAAVALGPNAPDLVGMNQPPAHNINFKPLPFLSLYPNPISKSFPMMLCLCSPCFVMSFFWLHFFPLSNPHKCRTLVLQSYLDIIQFLVRRICYLPWSSLRWPLGGSPARPRLNAFDSWFPLYTLYLGALLLLSSTFVGCRMTGGVYTKSTITNTKNHIHFVLYDFASYFRFSFISASIWSWL